MPSWCDDSFTGQIPWACVFTLVISFVCLPRKISSLRFASAFSIMLSLYVVLVIMCECFMLRGTSKSLAAGFKAGHEKAQLSLSGIASSLPLIIFSYMYQINIPQIYQELEVKSLGNAKKLLFTGTSMAAVVYICAGIFGYVTFADGSTVKQLDSYFSDNVLAAPYQMPDGTTPIPIYIALFGMMIVVVFAAPFCVLPTKDSIEEVRNKKLSNTENIVVTFLVCWLTCGISCGF